MGEGLLWRWQPTWWERRGSQQSTEESNPVARDRLPQGGPRSPSVNPSPPRPQGLRVLVGRATWAFPQGSLGFLQTSNQLILRYGSCTTGAWWPGASPPQKGRGEEG